MAPLFDVFPVEILVSRQFGARFGSLARPGRGLPPARADPHGRYGLDRPPGALQSDMLRMRLPPFGAAASVTSTASMGTVVTHDTHTIRSVIVLPLMSYSGIAPWNE